MSFSGSHEHAAHHLSTYWGHCKLDLRPALYWSKVTPMPMRKWSIVICIWRWLCTECGGIEFLPYYFIAIRPLIDAHKSDDGENLWVSGKYTDWAVDLNVTSYIVSLSFRPMCQVSNGNLHFHAILGMYCKSFYVMFFTYSAALILPLVMNVSAYSVRRRTTEKTETSWEPTYVCVCMKCTSSGIRT